MYWISYYYYKMEILWQIPFIAAQTLWIFNLIVKMISHVKPIYYYCNLTRFETELILTTLNKKLCLCYALMFYIITYLNFTWLRKVMPPIFKLFFSKTVVQIFCVSSQPIFKIKLNMTLLFPREWKKILKLYLYKNNLYKYSVILAF